jgi:hypothetical protein
MTVVKADIDKLVKYNQYGNVGIEAYDVVTDLSSEAQGRWMEVLGTSLGWTGNEPQQGFCRDATHWFTFANTIIKKIDLSIVSVATNLDPYAGSPQAGQDHMGDGDIYNGKLYVGNNIFGGAVPATGRTIAIYNTSDLTKFDEYDIETISPLVYASGVAVSLDGTELFCVGYFPSGLDPAGKSQIYVLDITDGTHKRSIELSEPLIRAQGIVCVAGGFTITSDDDGTVLTGYVTTVKDDGTVLPYRAKASAGHSGEMEGCTIYNGVFYANSINRSPVEYALYGENSLFVNEEWWSPQPLISRTLGDSGTILMRITPDRVYNYNNFFAQEDSGSSAWIFTLYADNNIQAWVDTGNRVIAPLLNPLNEHLLAFAWDNAAGTVTCKLGIDGIYEDTSVGSWVSPPSVDGLRFNTKYTDGSENSEANHRGYSIFNRVLTDAELLDASNNFDSLYTLFDIPLLSIPAISYHRQQMMRQ